jgi:hypothetical protein
MATRSIPIVFGLLALTGHAVAEQDQPDPVSEMQKRFSEAYPTSTSINSCERPEHQALRRLMETR